MKDPRKNLLLGAVAALALIGAASGAIGIDTPRAEAPAGPALGESYAVVNFADVIDAVSPAVVSIETVRPVRHISAEMRRRHGSPMEEFFGRWGWPHDGDPDDGPDMPHHGNKAFGSGFIVDASGFVVTNSHVVAGGEEIFVTLMDGTRLSAKLVGEDEKSDLALLKIDSGRALPALRFGDSAAARVGSPVMALGNPFGLGNSATVGIISAKGRGIGSGPYDDFLQIDAPINPGNSGGPLFNAQGEVIGVNTAIFSPSGGNIGIGFAIPAALAEEITADLRDDGKVERAWLGVAIQEVGEDMAQSLGIGSAAGAIVADVVAGSPAAAAGLKQGDVILKVNDVAVKELRDLTRTIARLEIGAPAVLTVWRDGREMTVEATVARPAEEADIASAPEGGATLEDLGLRLAALDDAARRAFGIDESVAGAVISGLDRRGIAAAKGLRIGDVVVSVGNAAVAAPGDVAAGIRRAEAEQRGAVLLLMNRGGQTRYVALPLGGTG
jgi:serine protease Do